MTTAATRGADVRVIPPLLYVLPLVLTLGVHLWIPLDIGARPTTAVAGIVVLGAGIALCGAGVTAVRRHHTTILPHHAVSTLVSSGPYRLSRNPMYTGLALAYLGTALLAGSWWPILVAPAILFAVHRLVIVREERYLAGTFGAEYAAYRARVRRWL